jgi:hypothetical protein
MAIVPKSRVSTEEVSNRVDRLQMQYRGNPLVKRIDYHIGVDWSDDPAVFVEVVLADKEIPGPELQRLAQNIRDRGKNGTEGPTLPEAGDKAEPPIKGGRQIASATRKSGEIRAQSPFCGLRHTPHELRRRPLERPVDYRAA